jgi:replicative DNA helicase
MLLMAADKIKGLAMDENQPLEVVTGASEAEILKAIGHGSGKPLASVGDVAGQVWEDAARVREEGRPRALPTPWSKLNLFNLMVSGRYGIIAGRPGMGKSWLLLILALWYAQHGHPVFFFSLEMTEADLTERALAIMSGVQSQKLDNGTASPQEWERFTKAVGDLNGIPLFIDTPPSGQPMTPALLRARVRRGLHQYPTDKMPFIMLDYIQHERMSGGERFEKQTNRHRELSYASAALAGLAIDTQSMVIVAAQLGREVADRADKTPIKEDLKESGSLEQDAWWVLLLHSDDYYNNPQAQVVTLDMIIDKNRGGQMGREQFKFDKAVGGIS